MTAPQLTIPPPLDDDHEDVAWALRAASAQWRRNARTDAVSWVRRAAETANEVGQMHRSVELSALADELASAPGISRPPPPTAPPPRPMAPPRPTGAAPPPLPPSLVGPPSVAAPPPGAPPAPVAPPPPGAPRSASMPLTAAAPPPPVFPVGPARPALPSLEIQFDEEPVASGSTAASFDDDVDELLEDDLILEELDEDEELLEDEDTPVSSDAARLSDEVLAQDEEPTDRGFTVPPASHPPAAPPPASPPPAAPQPEETSTSGASDEDPTDRVLVTPSFVAAAAARSSSPELVVDDVSLDDLGLDDLGLEGLAELPDDEDEGGFDEFEAPTNITSAPSSSAPASPPESEEDTAPEAPPFVEGAAVEVSDEASLAPATTPQRISFPPSGPPEEPFPLAPSAQQPNVVERASAPVPPPVEPVVDGVSLVDVSGLQDLPEDAQLELARVAVVKELSPGEEVSSVGVALVTAGSVEIMPAVADASCARAERGEVVFTRGSLADGVALRVVGAAPGTRVAVWSDEHLSAATTQCPWVADELALVADRYQALAGAVMGSLGDSLDAMFRGMVLEKCTVRRFGEGDVLVEGGKTADGMYIVGAGWVELLGPDGSSTQELGPGDFLFPETILAASPARATARAGRGGALVLYASRMDAHELLATCPPFIELLAG